MSEYVPTLEDAKRTYAYIQGGLDHDDGYTPFYQVHEEAFDRMIAALIREAKAEALEEAASSAIPRKALATDTRTWLRARAAEYRKAVGS